MRLPVREIRGMQKRPLPAHLLAEGFTTREGRDAGLGRRRMKAPDVVAPFRGIRVAATGLDDARLSAASALLGDRLFFSHLTAARLWNMRLPRGTASQDLHISACLPDHAPRMPGIVGHRLTEERVELALFDGVRLTDPTETWRHLSTILRVDDLVVAGDGLVRREQPLASTGQLHRALARHGGLRGVRRLREAFELIRPGTDSAQETHLRLHLVRHGLPEPEVNLPIRLPDGSTTPGDLAYPEQRVLVEYDGRVHLTPRQLARDIRRLEQLALAGWLVVRVLFEHMADPAAIVARVRTAAAVSASRAARE